MTKIDFDRIVKSKQKLVSKNTIVKEKEILVKKKLF
jgi:hypothetical protein